MLPPEYVRVHYPALCERYLSILPWTTSITAAAIYCPKDIRARSGCGSRRRSARAELGDAALELVAAELRDCHQRLVERRCSEADRTYQSLASPPSELPAAVIAPV